jgi:hypothetical protein
MQSFYDTVQPSATMEDMSYSNSSGSDVGGASSGYQFNSFPPHNVALNDAVDSSRWIASSYTAYDPLRQLQQAQLVYAQQSAPPGSSIYPENLQPIDTIGQAMGAIDLYSNNLKPSPTASLPGGLPSASTRRLSFGDDVRLVWSVVEAVL